MTDPRPTREQWTAIRELDKHLTVSAGAGAGKTWVLTERYTAMLAGHPMVLPPHELEATEGNLPPRDPSRPHQIVAITFTKEAAGEMKGRIRNRLSKWKREAQPELQRQIAELKEEVERATITTIHGYCSELLREYPMEAGIDPQFRVLEESEAGWLLDEALREILDAGMADEDAAVIRLLTEYGYEPLVASLTRFYPSVLEQTADFAAVAVHTLAKLDELSSRLEPAVDRLEQLLRDLAALDWDALDAKKGSVQRGLRFRDDWPQIERTLRDWRESDWTFNEAVQDVIGGLTEGWGVLVKDLKEPVNALKQHVPTLNTCIVPAGMREMIGDLCAVLSRLHSLYTAKKLRERALDFSDLQNRAVRLLEHPEVRQWQGERLRFLMVDEFQDTNPMQKRLLDALSAENEQLKLFVVGDAKQSIYRFRGADLEVFLQTQEQVRDRQGDHVSLMHNFRTQEPIISFVNRLFRELMPEQEGGPKYATQYEAMAATRPSEHEQPMVELMHLLPQGGDAMQDKLQEAEAVAERIAQMVGQEALVPTGDGLRPVEYRDITILFSAMTNVFLYEHALQTRGIPYYIIGSRHFYKRQEVQDLVLLLQVIVESRDVIALIGTLRSPLFGVSDEALYWLGRAGLTAGEWETNENWMRIAPDDQAKLRRAHRLLSEWRQQRVYKSAGDLLATVLEQTGYEQAMLLTFGGQQKVGNVRKLLELAYDQPSDRAGVLPFLQHMHRMLDGEVKEEDAQVESDSSNVVKIMTIHKSKGLEFPVVILPDMARTFNLSTNGPFRYDPEFGLVPSFSEHDAWNEYGYATHLFDLNKRKSLEEERRKLYVALTRARDYLLLVGTREEPKAAKSKKLMTRDDSRWFDWLVAAMAEGDLSQMKSNVAAVWPEVKYTRWLPGGFTPAHQQEQNATPWMAAFSEAAASQEVAAASEPALATAPEFAERAAAVAPLLGRVTPRADEIPGVAMSVSALMTYLTCPRQYFYKYEWKLPEQPPLAPQQLSFDEIDDRELTSQEREEKEPGYDPTERGTLVHRALELLQDPAAIDGLIDRALAERSIVGEEAQRWHLILREDVRRYADSSLFQEVQAAAEQKSELMFRLALGKHSITGIIDKVIRRPDGRAVVIDYKTNRIGPKQLVKTTSHYAPQLQLYTLVTQNLLGWPVDRATLYFTALDRESTVPTAPQDLQALERQIVSACDHIAAHDEQDAYAEASTDHPCRTCGYRLLCKGE